MIATNDADAVLAKAEAAGVPAAVIGKTGGDAVTLSSGETIPLATLKDTNESWLPSYMGLA